MVEMVGSLRGWMVGVSGFALGGTSRGGMILARRADREKFSGVGFGERGGAGASSGQRTAGSRAQAGSANTRCWRGPAHGSGRVGRVAGATGLCWLCGRYGSTPTGRDCVQIKDPLPKSLSQPQPQPRQKGGAGELADGSTGWGARAEGNRGVCGDLGLRAWEGRWRRACARERMGSFAARARAKKDCSSWSG